MLRSRKKRIVFQLHAPGAKAVFLAGTFNEWDPASQPMTRNGNGEWKTAMSLKPGTYEYRFVVDGEWRDDPACEARHLNEFGTYNSLMYV